MKLCRDHIFDVKTNGEKVIGYWGAPPPRALMQAAENFNGTSFIDLDVYFDVPNSQTIPDAYCHIIRNCIDNALYLQNQLVAIVAATGEEKCDAGRYAAQLLQTRLKCPVYITTNNAASVTGEPLLSCAQGSVKHRAIRIMDSIIEPLTKKEKVAARARVCTPTVGFWGTPPHPIQVLDLFPDTTHIFGWTRIVELGAPANLALETAVPTDLPIVFFSQGFCAKALLAKQLADKYQGMHVDVHDTLNAATRAKIEAFIRLSTQEL